MFWAGFVVVVVDVVVVVVVVVVVDNGPLPLLCFICKMGRAMTSNC